MTGSGIKGPVLEKLKQAGQDHVLKWWNELEEKSQHKLINQIESIDLKLIQRLGALLKENTNHGVPLKMTPAPVISLPKTTEEHQAAIAAKKVGENIIRAGKVAAFVVAGGQGTRLGYDGPKGCYPIGPVSGKSIFQLHAENILAAGKQYQTVIPWYIMTSETNDQPTRHFFEKNQYFGLNPVDVVFIKQRMLPALDEEGKLILDAKDHIFTSPNGHGGALQALVETGAIEDMKQRGIEAISYFQVDNVLIRIVDPVFIGYHVQANAEMSSKMLKKRSPYEKLGHFGMVDGRLYVVEYSDMSDEDMLSRNPDGSLKYNAGSPAIHVIHPDFVLQEMEGGLRLPYHIAQKKIPFLDESGDLIIPEIPNGYKFEAFIFDALHDTTKSVILEAAREKEFSPVKNKTGEDSPETARRDLTNYFGEWMEAAGMHIPRDSTGNVQGMIEISPLFANTKEVFVKKADASWSFDGSFYCA